ncbi:MAG: glycosyltransferase family 2 protein [Deltaproteobacteria bacterium]|nr:glycosyltransferase family 2 protein [Deltaproteobacteria bacterium]
MGLQFFPFRICRFQKPRSAIRNCMTSASKMTSRARFSSTGPGMEEGRSSVISFFTAVMDWCWRCGALPRVTFWRNFRKPDLRQHRCRGMSRAAAYWTSRLIPISSCSGLPNRPQSEGGRRSRQKKYIRLASSRIRIPMNAFDNVSAIVVTYHPKIVVLQKLLDALGEQIGSIVLVDNGSGEYLQEFMESRRRDNEYLICLGSNLGVAAAHNRGMAWARGMGKTHVVLFDQDSMPAPDMVFQLTSNLLKIEGQGIKVAAVGPRYQDERNMDRPSFISVSGFKVVKHFCRPEDHLIESDVLISSGSLIPLSVLDEVGGPLNALFIDQVDFEWCFRVRSCGYRLFGVCGAVLHHSMGENPGMILGKKFLHHGPLRHYYIFRNAVWLLGKNYVPPGWKFLFIRTMLVRLMVYGGFISPRLDYLKMMTKGIWHGIKGQLGELGTSGKD